MDNVGPVLILGTRNTKQLEIDYLIQQLESLQCQTQVLDIALDPVHHKAMDDKQKVQAMETVVATTLKEVLNLVENGEIKAIIGLGGGVGTWIALSIMSRLPLGLPKVVISTLPFDPRSLAATKDIIIIPAVVDILGLNSILRMILHKAATITVSLLNSKPIVENNEPMIGLTALGVTNLAAIEAQHIFEQNGFEVATFHANGAGGTAFGECIKSGLLTGVLDLTTTEVASLLFGDVVQTEPHRLENAANLGIPQVVVPGGITFVTRGPLQSLSSEEQKRLFYQHSPTFTHVRLTKEELIRVAEVMAQKLNKSIGPITVAIPLQGFSHEDRVGGAIYDPVGNQAFVTALKAALTPSVPVVEVDAHINDPIFISKACQLLLEKLPKTD